jgi:hypothetical protein
MRKEQEKTGKPCAGLLNFSRVPRVSWFNQWFPSSLSDLGGELFSENFEQKRAGSI